MRGRQGTAISRRAVMKFARRFFKGKVRSYVRALTVETKLHFIEVAGKIVGQGDSWATAYMNMRANLPRTPGGRTDWRQLDAGLSS